MKYDSMSCLKVWHAFCQCVSILHYGAFCGVMYPNYLVISV